MDYKGPQFTTGPATARSYDKVADLLRIVRDSENEWMRGELGNLFGFRNLETAEWRGYIQHRISTLGPGCVRKTDFIEITPSGRRYLDPSL